jgi:hypothetical protein
MGTPGHKKSEITSEKRQSQLQSQQREEDG